jgi:hypothetical protein
MKDKSIAHMAYNSVLYKFMMIQRAKRYISHKVINGQHVPQALYNLLDHLNKQLDKRIADRLRES